MIIHRELEQRTDEWHQLKAGKFSASRTQPLVTGKPATKRSLFIEKAAERITGRPSDAKFFNKHMERGNELEEEAREYFSTFSGLKTTIVGFIEPDSGPLKGWFGVSPDFIIEEQERIKSGGEIKCKDNHTHLNCLMNGRDKSHDWQIQASIFQCKVDGWYFISYNKNFPTNMRLYVEYVPRDEVKINDIVEGLYLGRVEVEKIIKNIETFKPNFQGV